MVDDTEFTNTQYHSRPVPHRNLKKFLSPAFTVASVDKLDSFFKACVSTLLDNYYNEVNKAIAEDPKTNPNGNVETDFMRDLHCLALDIMGQSSFGKGFGQIDKIFDPSKMLTGRDRRWSKIPDAIFDGQARRYGLVFIKRFLRRMGYEWEVDWPKEMTTAICELVDERAAAQGTVKSEERIDVLQHMLDEGARPDTGERMSNQDIIDQMSELLLAGSETTSGKFHSHFPMFQSSASSFSTLTSKHLSLRLANRTLRNNGMPLRRTRPNPSRPNQASRFPSTPIPLFAHPRL